MSNSLARRNEEMFQDPIPTLSEIDSAYQRQLRRKELLKQKLAKKYYQEEQRKQNYFISSKNIFSVKYCIFNVRKIFLWCKNTDEKLLKQRGFDFLFILVGNV